MGEGEKMKNLEKLVETLIRLPSETTWVEFKHDNYIPEMIGERISGLANAATLDDRALAYMIWGVHDKTHEIVGTSHDLQSIHIGTDELEGWLRQRLSRNVDFKFEQVSLTNESRLLACYWHACVKQVQEDQLTNNSLRVRFGLPESSAGIVSRLIKDAVEKKLIKPFDPNAGRKYMRYIPIWA